MPDILIRDVEAAVHEELKVRAKAAGQTLQGYLRDLLIQEARSEDLVRWYAQVTARQSSRPGLDVVEALHAARAERDEQLS